jgi:hypothetical protein
MKCSNAAFGEQNKTDNDSKCQQVYKSLKKNSGIFGIIESANNVNNATLCNYEWSIDFQGEIVLR